MKILVTGAFGFVGKNLSDELKNDEFSVYVMKSSNFDLRDYKITNQIVRFSSPDIVIHLAAKVGGLFANRDQQRQFYVDNMLINTNIVEASINNNVKYFCTLGSGCSYSDIFENEIMSENNIFDGKLRYEHECYAHAKRGMLYHLMHSGIKYSYLIPANIYGKYDNFSLQDSHVVPGLISRMYNDRDKEEFTVFGTGICSRDLIYVRDLTYIIKHLCKTQWQGVMNVATGELTQISTLAEKIKDLLGYKGELIFDNNSDNNGAVKRLFDTTVLNNTLDMNFTSLDVGLKETVDFFLSEQDDNKK